MIRPNEITLFNNVIYKKLFSKHYVEEKFIETSLYKELTPSNELKREIKELCDQERNKLLDYNESMNEDRFIRKLFHILKLFYIINVETSAGKPDYAIFTSEVEVTEANKKARDKYLGSVAIADAKRWGRDFDKKRGDHRDNNPNSIPTKQIANYISELGINWGILTDGQRWRLYNRNVFPVSESFIEIDLFSALEDDKLFHLFYALFSGEAFSKNAQVVILKESKSYWVKIGDDLKEKAYTALEILCNGFAVNFSDLNNENIRDIYEASITLLYRILFVLNAEKRELLPIKENSYKNYSLNNILDVIKSQNENDISDRRYGYYNHLCELFSTIDKGDETLKVPQYNGGLFKDEGLPYLPPNFLTTYRVPDRFLVMALKMIGFSSGNRNGSLQAIDYGELDVRHLGTIYEGLLEFHPEIRNGKIELFTDKGERRATGSYYTPDWVVKYIVENTLGKLTDGLKTPDEVLSLKILDPAMGSGHFLVSAIDFIGRKCSALAGEDVEKTEKDYQRIAVEQCVFGVDINPLAVELAKLSLWLHTIAVGKPLSFLDHHLKLGNSLLGARIENLEVLPKNKKNEKQTSIFTLRLKEKLPFIMKEVLGILLKPSESIKDINEKETLLFAAKETLKPFTAVANTWLSTFFGNTVSKEDYETALSNISQPTTLSMMPVVKAANEMSDGNEHDTGRLFFHWELEFPEVFFDADGNAKENPGFNSVVGNPPYVEERTVLSDYYRTNKTGNLYSYFIEQSLELLKNEGQYSFIVPLSLTFSAQMQPVRDLLIESSSELRYITLAKRPASVFPHVQQRTTLFVCKKEIARDKYHVFSSKYLRWNWGEEENLLSNLEFTDVSDFLLFGKFPKIGSTIGHNILKKLFKNENKLGSLFNGNRELYLHNVGMYWINCFLFKALFQRSDGNFTNSSTTETINTSNENNQYIVCSLISSSLFYYYWIVFGDDFHITSNDVSIFPLFSNELSVSHFSMIKSIIDRLMSSYKDNSFIKKTQQATWQEFRPSLSKSIIDELDEHIAMLYGLSSEEREFLRNYDLEFRMHED